MVQQLIVSTATSLSPEAKRLCECRFGVAIESIDPWKDEIADLTQKLTELDQTVAGATEHREQENPDFFVSNAELNAAVQLIE